MKLAAGSTFRSILMRSISILRLAAVETRRAERNADRAGGCQKDKINELTELVKAAGLVPIVMDVDAFA